MTTLPNMSLVLPTRGAGGSGQWADALDAIFAIIDTHQHASGLGVAVPVSGLNINADMSFASVWAPTNLHRITFASITALAANNKSMFVSSSDNELYWRSNTGTNVKLTSGNTINTSLVGGIVGDYTSVAAALSFDDSLDAYLFKQNAATGWARLRSGEVRISETGTGESFYVGLAAPAALAASWTITLPLAAPGSTVCAQVSSAGVMSLSNTIDAATLTGATLTTAAAVTLAAGGHVTVSGSGDYKHGDKTMMLHGWEGRAGGPYVYATDWTYNAVNGNVKSLAMVTLLFPFRLRVGDRVKSVTYTLLGDGVADVSNADVVKFDNGTAASIGSTTNTNPGGTLAPTTIDVTDTTITSTMTMSLRLDITAANIEISSVAVTYDRP